MVLITIIIVLVTIVIQNVVYAIEQIDISTNKEIINKGENIEITVNLSNRNIASLTLNIFFDKSKLEYVQNKTENSNFLQNRVIYTWTDSGGGKVKRSNDKIETFTFKALENGIANIVVTGEFYDSSGKMINVEDGSIQLNIGSNENKEDIKQENVSDSNADLEIMRLSEEGISPEFQKNIKEYYMVINNSINNLEVTAIPENKKANVKITGNTNLKNGINQIKIEVQSPNKKNNNTYVIYVTKTKNQELANSNLENLAIKQGMLYPPFDSNITKYNLEVSKDITNLDILAIPQKINAKVKIIGNNELKIGNNIITIIVTAEDGITTKKYVVTVYRRNEKEEVEKQEEQKKETEKLSSILNEQRQEELIEKENTQNEPRINFIDMITWVLLGIIIVSFLVAFIIHTKNLT